jgi:hypothetical protein
MGGRYPHWMQAADSYSGSLQVNPCLSCMDQELPAALTLLLDARTINFGCVSFLIGAG